MKYMLSKLTDRPGSEYHGQPTLGTFDKAFGHFISDGSAQRTFARIIERKEFAAGNYGIFRGPNASSDGVKVHTMKKVQATREMIR